MVDQATIHVGWTLYKHMNEPFIHAVSAEEMDNFKVEVEEKGLYAARFLVPMEQGGGVDILAVSDQYLSLERVFDDVRVWLVKHDLGTLPEGSKPKTRFKGEMMTCCMCGKKQKSDPDVESNWTFIQMDEYGFYVCPGCLQDSKQAQNGNYTTAYEKVLRRMARLVERDRQRRAAAAAPLN